MSRFLDWLLRRQPALVPTPAPAPQPEPEQELPDGLYEVDGRLYARCHSCENKYEWPGDELDFDESMSYCGGSQFCLP